RETAFGDGDGVRQIADLAADPRDRAVGLVQLRRNGLYFETRLMKLAALSLQLRLRVFDLLLALLDFDVDGHRRRRWLCPRRRAERREPGRAESQHPSGPHQAGRRYRLTESQLASMPTNAPTSSSSSARCPIGTAARFSGRNGKLSTSFGARAP